MVSLLKFEYNYFKFQFKFILRMELAFLETLGMGQVRMVRDFDCSDCRSAGDCSLFPVRV